MEKSEKKHSRRTFLKLKSSKSEKAIDQESQEVKKSGVQDSNLFKNLLGLGVAGWAAGQMIGNEEKPELVKMITLDGKLMEVDKKYINKMCAGRVSNESLKNWIEKEKCDKVKTQ